MRKALVVLATVALFQSSGALAFRVGPQPPACPGGGVTSPPFYGVRAVLPVTGRHSVEVSGGYALKKRGVTVKLVEVKPQGINPRILLLRLVQVPDPAAFGDCRPFKNVFAGISPAEVRIAGPHGKSITVPVHRKR
jgi:hypothetical protein